MDIRDIKVGDLLEILVHSSIPLPAGLGNIEGLEVIVHRSEELSEYLLTVASHNFPVEGVSSNDQYELNNIVTNMQGYLAYTSNLTKNGAESFEVLLSIRSFSTKYKLIEENKVPILISDGNLVELQKKFIRKTKLSSKDIIDWLEEHILIKSASGYFLTISAGHSEGVENNHHAFRIYGNRIALDVQKGSNGYQIKKMVHLNGAVGTRPIILLQGNFEIRDQSVEAVYGNTYLTEIDNLVSQSSSYLGLWQEYNQLEKKILVDKVRSVGWIAYQKLEKHSYFWRLIVSNKGKKSLESFVALDERDLEISKNQPRELADDYDINQDNEENWFQESRGGLAVECINIDLNHGWIDIIPLDWDDQPVPPPNGFIYSSLSGDRVRLRRRSYAWKRIRQGKNGIPLLGFLLERSDRYMPRNITEKLTSREKILEAFGGTPTETQARAIELAINTPDIVVIQGPPGTGKTRVISAINKLLSEDRKGHNDPFGRTLLTSYQHFAVENAASRTSVFGLPALKFGRQRHKDTHIDPTENWKRNALVSLTNDPNYGGIQTARTLARQIHFELLAYIKNPGNLLETGKLLREIHAKVYHLLSPELGNNLLKLSSRLSSESILAQRKHDDDIRSLKAAANGLPENSVAFEDNGPAAAYYLLQKVKDVAWFPKEKIQHLQAASDWYDNSPPPFLGELSEIKRMILQKVNTPVAITFSNLPNADVEDILTEVTRALMMSANEEPDSPEAVIEQYVLDLENDPEDVKKTLWHYSAVLAATCQQAVSKPMLSAKGIDETSDLSLEFESVIVDEAARANPLDLLIPMSLATRRIVLVGDHRQLPHILEPDVERKLEKSAERTQEALGKSLFQRLFDHFRNYYPDGKVRTITLDQQYRMHPILGDFVSRTFYEKHDPNERFRSDNVTENHFSHNLKGYENKIACWLNVSSIYGAEKGGLSKFRTAEARAIAREAKNILQQDHNISVGIITFYRDQVQEILKALRKNELAEDVEGILQVRREINETGERLRVGTVDAFQGKEFDVVFLSMVRSNQINPEDDDEILQRRKFGFLTLENRLCVAMSRQKKLLIVVGDNTMIEHRSSQHAVPGLHAFYYEFCLGNNGIFQEFRA